MAELGVYSGGWALWNGSEEAVAFHVERGARIALTGFLRHGVALFHTEGAQRLAGTARALGASAPDLLDLSEALGRRIQEPCLKDVLAPLGFARLFIELTGRCNERCLHCYASSGPEVESELSLDEVLGALNDAKELGFRAVQFTGGDPLISKHLRSSVGRARELGFESIEVYTNGIALTPELADFLASQGVRMAVSVYSHRPEIHDAVTQTHDSHTRTLRAIRLAVERSIPIRVSVILRDENQADTEAVRRMVLELGVPADQVACDRERPVGRGSWKESAPIPESEEQLVHASPLGKGGEGSEMPRGQAKLAINYEGDVVPCIFDRRTRLGSIRERSLSDILSQPVRAAESKVVRLLVASGEPLACFDCSERKALLEYISWDAP